MTIDQPFGNHNGGHILFGRDGYLYVALGDGGDGGETDPEDQPLGRPPRGNAQTLSTLLGSVLRIDVDGGRPYGVPADNPFAGRKGRDEVFAYGLRNPYGLSLDLETGDLYAAEAGQALYEEMNRIERGGNHGWNIREGTACFDPDNFPEPRADCRDTGYHGEPLRDPVVAYRRRPDRGSVVVTGVMCTGGRRFLSCAAGSCSATTAGSSHWGGSAGRAAARPAPSSRRSPPCSTPCSFSGLALGLAFLLVVGACQ